MKKKAIDLRQRVDRLTEELEQAQHQLNSHVRSCHHQYGPTQYDPIITEAYTIPGDPPGTMGVDWRGPCHVPRKEEKRWKRVCELCGDVQYTKRIRKEIKEHPDW